MHGDRVVTIDYCDVTSPSVFMPPLGVFWGDLPHNCGVIMQQLVQAVI